MKRAEAAEWICSLKLVYVCLSLLTGWLVRAKKVFNRPFQSKRMHPSEWGLQMLSCETALQQAGAAARSAATFLSGCLHPYIYHSYIYSGLNVAVDRVVRVCRVDKVVLGSSSS